MIMTTCLAKLSCKVGAFLICVSCLVLFCPGQALAQSFQLSDTRVLSGGTLTGKFILTGGPPQDVIIELHSNNSDVATVKTDKVTVKQGAKDSEEFVIEAQNFQIEGQNPQDGKRVTIEARFNNESYFSEITVYPLLIIPTSITAGDEVRGIINLLAPAPANGAKVQLANNSPELNVPGTVTVPQNLLQEEFKITANTVGSNSKVRITAVYAPDSKIKGNQFVDLVVNRNNRFLFYSILAGIVANFIPFVLIPWLFGARNIISNLIFGKDGLPSTSKTQNLLWTFFVLLAYSSIATLQICMGEKVNIAIERNIIIVLGASFAVRVLSSVVTTNQTQDGKMFKRSPEQTEEYLRKSKKEGFRSLSFLFTDDNGRVDLNKIQIMAWTFIALFIFTTEWLRNLLHDNVRTMELPKIDDSLVVLMGLASGAFVGGKLVLPPPTISHLDPDHGKADDEFKIFGSAFGDLPGEILVKNAKGDTIKGWEVVKWSNTFVTAKVDSVPNGIYKIGLLAKGQISENTKDFKVE